MLQPFGPLGLSAIGCLCQEQPQNSSVQPPQSARQFRIGTSAAVMHCTSASHLKDVWDVNFC